MPAAESQGQREPLLAVGMPVYNGAQWLQESIEKILSQRFTDFELLISDNASDDDTELICSRFAREDPRVRYRRLESNQGVFRNHNDVFDLTSSKYFKWASCSDLCEPLFFQRCIELLEARDEVVLAYPQSVIFSSLDPKGVVYYQNLTLEDDRPSARIRMFYDWVGLNNAYYGIFRRSVLAKLMPCREARRFEQNLMAELSLYGKFVEVREPLFYRRHEPGSTGELLQGDARRPFFGPADAELGYRQMFARRLDKFVMPFRAPIPLLEKLRIELDQLYRLEEFGRLLVGKIYAIVRRLS